MMHRCQTYEGAIVDMVEGQISREAEAHLATCTACSKRLAQLRTIVAAIKTPRFHAPADAIARAQSLMRPTANRTVARLLNTSFGAAGARAASEDFQLVVGADEVSVRLMYARVGRDWEVLGRAPSAAWRFQRGNDEVECVPNGRFHFLAHDLSDSAFALSEAGTARRIEVPSAEELLERAP